MIVRNRDILTDLFLFALFFLFVRIAVNPALYYYFPADFRYSNGLPLSALPDLYQTWPSLLFTFYPGIASDSVGAELVVLCGSPWAGALIITGLFWVIVLLSGYYCSRVDGEHFLLVRAVPAIVILGLLLHYEQFFADAVSLIFALIGVVLYSSISLKKRIYQLVVFSGLAICVMLSSKSYVPFLLLCLINDVVHRKSGGMVLSQLAVGAAIPLIALFFLNDMGVAGIVAFLVPQRMNGDQAGFALRLLLSYSVPVTVLFCAVESSMRSRKITGRITTPSWIVPIVLIGVLTGLVWKGTYVPEIKVQRMCTYCLYTRQWNRLSAQARKLPPASISPFYSHGINRALYHKGVLLDSLFSFPQFPDALLLTGIANGNNEHYRRWIWSGWTLFELGFINNAENVAYEACAQTSHFPEGLCLLAFIHMVKGKPEAAKTFLHALKKDRIYRSLAIDYLQRIENNPTLSRDSMIVAARTNMLTQDNVQGVTIESLLERNPRNRMAFEYMVAEYLLVKDLARFEDCLRYFPNFTFKKTPQFIEEGLLINELLLQRKSPSGIAISRESQDRFRKFTNVLNEFNNQKDAARAALAKQFGTTYFFYYLYGYTRSMKTS